MSRRFSVGSEDDGDGEDYYMLLNVARDASLEQINAAYRRLCRLYHPDKHMEAGSKRQTELMFARLQRAHETLRDEQRRALYDQLGVQALQSPSSWQLVTRTRTTGEIYDEYRRLAREAEERRLQQSTNPRGSVTLEVDASDLLLPYDELLLPHVSGMTFTQSVEAPLTGRDTACLAGQLSTANGTGQGQLSCWLRRVVSERCWLRGEVGVGSGLMLAASGYRTYSRHVHGTASCYLNLLPGGLERAGVAATINCQLDRHTSGALTYRLGLPSGVQAQLVHETDETRTRCSVLVALPHSHLTAGLALKLPSRCFSGRLLARVGTFGFLVELGVEQKPPASPSMSRVSGTLSVGAPTGVAVRLKLQRAGQQYQLCVRVCDELLPEAVLYGALLPPLICYCVNALLVAPYLARRRNEETQRRRDATRERTGQRRRDARAAVQLMAETVERIRRAERAANGLLITSAIYGAERDTTDVTVPLQCLVAYSCLALQEGSKCFLPGFYDPCPDEDKTLLVEYSYRGLDHRVESPDTEPLQLPKTVHRAGK